jgi:hypothetical protein
MGKEYLRRQHFLVIVRFAPTPIEPSPLANTAIMTTSLSAILVFLFLRGRQGQHRGLVMYSVTKVNTDTIYRNYPSHLRNSIVPDGLQKKQTTAAEIL